MSSNEFKTLQQGMPMAVAERTILRKTSDISRESWEDVAKRVALGNALLCPNPEDVEGERIALEQAIGKATLLMSGRHLQHGDKEQPKRPQEVFTNCSTSPTSFLLFYLLLNGSGVGRSYDNDLMLVDWDNAPNLRCVLSDTHPDFDWSRHESVRDAQHKYGTGKNVLWHEVADSREGWAKALELWENAAFEKIHGDKLLVLDFSQVRPKGSPIGGMQNRPASGPRELMDAFEKSAKLKGAGLAPWKQAIYVDHYFAECVLVGGARRAARMATKTWRDKNVLDFVTVKRPLEYVGKTPEQIIEAQKAGKPQGFLWSSNNSVTVDAEFWNLVNGSKGDATLRDHAKRVFEAACEASYYDGTGEPGFINVDRLTQKDDGYKELLSGSYVGSKRFQVNEDTHLYLAKIARKARQKTHAMITNPCQPAWAPVITPTGLSTIGALKEGDQIWSETGWTTVTKKWSTGVKPVYRYRTTAGTFYATENHRVVSGGVKVEVKDADSIDRLSGPYAKGLVVDPQDVMDGIVFGDGTVHEASNDRIVIYVGDDDGDYHHSEVSRLIGKHRPGIGPKAWEVVTSIQPSELPLTFNRSIPDRFVYTAPHTVAGFLRGLYTANGSIVADRITLKASSFKVIEQVQLMLSSLGIASYYTTNQPTRVKFANGEYLCRESYDLNVTRDRATFAALIGFIQMYKVDKVDALLKQERRATKSPKVTFDIVGVEQVSEEEVFDITVDNESHTYWTGGLNVSNCGEIALTVVGGFCVIADIVPYHADTLDEAEQAFRIATRALMRVNLMDSVYGKEVKRTNRIGVGITGIHEFAWKFFKLGFRDLIDEKKAREFWLTLARFHRAVRDEAERYSKHLGVSMPHTLTTIKPAGTTSKLFMLTEGWHLPSMREFLRWVQFRTDDPLVKDYQRRGYPIRALKTYAGTTIVGFPTAPTITTLGMGDKLVTAAEATPEQQYQWLVLGEKYWIDGTDEAGEPLTGRWGNQISYTLKYFPDKVTYASFREMMLRHQSQIKCCSVMPQVDSTAYEYQPEQPVSSAEYAELTAKIQRAAEDVDFSHIDCAAGACPVDFQKAALKQAA